MWLAGESPRANIPELISHHDLKSTCYTFSVAGDETKEYGDETSATRHRLEVTSGSRTGDLWARISMATSIRFRAFTGTEHGPESDRLATREKTMASGSRLIGFHSSSSVQVVDSWRGRSNGKSRPSSDLGCPSASIELARNEKDDHDCVITVGPCDYKERPQNRIFLPLPYGLSSFIGLDSCGHDTVQFIGYLCRYCMH
jgi:hypothetical protein